MYDIPKDELARVYLDEGLSIEECAEYFGCSTSPIEGRLRSYDIPVRNRGNQPMDVSYDVLYNLYVKEGMTTVEVAEELDCHPSTVGKKLQEHDIPTTGPNHGRSIDIPEEELVRLYIDEERTTYEIAEYYDCDPTVVERRLEWYDVEIRHTATDGTWSTSTGPLGAGSAGRRSNARIISVSGVGSPTRSTGRDTSSRPGASDSASMSTIG